MKTICFLILIIISSSLVGHCQETEWDILPFEEIVIGCTEVADGNYCINDLSTYQITLSKRAPFIKCQTYVLPEIDFDLFTFVQVQTSLSSTASEGEISIIKNKINGNVIITLEIEQSGIHRDLDIVRKKILIEKTSCEKIDFKIKINKI